jgi:hypothetical protein
MTILRVSLQAYMALAVMVVPLLMLPLVHVLPVPTADESPRFGALVGLPVADRALLSVDDSVQGTHTHAVDTEEEYDDDKDDGIEARDKDIAAALKEMAGALQDNADAIRELKVSIVAMKARGEAIKKETLESVERSMREGFRQLQLQEDEPEAPTPRPPPRGPLLGTGPAERPQGVQAGPEKPRIVIFSPRWCKGQDCQRMRADVAKGSEMFDYLVVDQEPFPQGWLEIAAQTGYPLVTWQDSNGRNKYFEPAYGQSNWPSEEQLAKAFGRAEAMAQYRKQKQSGWSIQGQSIPTVVCWPVQQQFSFPQQQLSGGMRCVIGPDGVQRCFPR